MRAFLHYLRRGHPPQFIMLGPHRICEICDLGTPTGSSIRPMLPANASPLNNQRVMGAGAFGLST